MVSVFLWVPGRAYVASDPQSPNCDSCRAPTLTTMELARPVHFEPCFYRPHGAARAAPPQLRSPSL